MFFLLQHLFSPYPHPSNLNSTLLFIAPFSTSRRGFSSSPVHPLHFHFNLRLLLLTMLLFFLFALTSLINLNWACCAYDFRFCWCTEHKSASFPKYFRDLLISPILPNMFRSHRVDYMYNNKIARGRRRYEHRFTLDWSKNQHWLARVKQQAARGRCTLIHNPNESRQAWFELKTRDTQNGRN